MEKLSGLVLDVYDDPDGEILRGIFPTYEQVPDLIKQAHQLSSEQRRELPEDLFALELVDGGASLRKYACVDAGNTVLSVEYFMKTAHKLPIMAQKTAARNLVTACGWYGIDPPEGLQKIALGIGTAIGLAQVPGVVKGTGGEIKRRKEIARQSGAIVNPAIAQ